MFQLTFLAREDKYMGRYRVHLALEKSTSGLNGSISNSSTIYTKFIQPLKNISANLDIFQYLFVEFLILWLHPTLSGKINRRYLHKRWLMIWWEISNKWKGDCWNRLHNLVTIVSLWKYNIIGGCVWFWFSLKTLSKALFTPSKSRSEREMGDASPLVHASPFWLTQYLRRIITDSQIT